MGTPEPQVTFACPRCDRKYTGKSWEEVETKVVNHVKEAHPDHDPDWNVEETSTEAEPQA